MGWPSGSPGSGPKSGLSDLQKEGQRVAFRISGALEHVVIYRDFGPPHPAGIAPAVTPSAVPTPPPHTLNRLTWPALCLLQCRPPLLPRLPTP
eukprot:366290-Chlamydomonas_euryale.AAC.10